MLIINLIKLLRECDEITGTEQAVLIHLAEHRNVKTGQCNPGRQLLGKEAHCGQAKVRTAIAKGEARGLFTVRVQQSGYRKKYFYDWSDLLVETKITQFDATTDAFPLIASVNGAIDAPLIASVNGEAIPVDHGDQPPLIASVNAVDRLSQRPLIEASDERTNTTYQHENEPSRTLKVPEDFAHVVKVEENTEEESVTPVPTPRRTFRSIKPTPPSPSEIMAGIKAERKVATA